LLKIALGERASLLLGGQRVLPVKLEQLGFSFNHPEINEALSKSCH
jgi:NAD dependent epimerase/dehydratase family enzyme